MNDSFEFEDATECENCGAPNAGALVDDTVLCGSCATEEAER